MRRAVLAVSILIAVRAGAQSVKPLGRFEAYVWSPAISPDGKLLAWDGKGIVVRPLAGGNGITFATDRDDFDGIPHHPQWSPDGKRIAYSYASCHHCTDRLYVKSYPQGVEQSLGEICGSPVSWTPDGRFLIAAEPKDDDNEDCRIALIPVDGGRRTALTRDGDVVALSPDGKRLAFAAKNHVMFAELDAAFRFSASPETIAREPHEISSIHWTADGRSFLYQVWGEYSKIVSAQGAPAARLISLGGNIIVDQILPDGSALGTEIGRRESLWRMDMRSPTRDEKRVADISWMDHHLRVSPDGESLAFATNRNGLTQIWITRFDGSAPRVLLRAIPPFDELGDRTAVDALSWSPDQKWIALSIQPGIGHGDERARVYLISVADGRLRKLADCSMGPDTPLWSADSRSLFVAKNDEKFDTRYFRVDIVTGKQTEVVEAKLPQSAVKATGLNGFAEPHFTQGGRYVFFTKREERGSRIVQVEKLLHR